MRFLLTIWKAILKIFGYSVLTIAHSEVKKPAAVNRFVEIKKPGIAVCRKVYRNRNGKNS